MDPTPKITPDRDPEGNNERLAARLFPSNGARLLAIARRNTDNEWDAEEALQDAFAIFIDHYDPRGGAEPLAWITLTLKRRCWAITTAGRRHRPAGHIEELSTPKEDRDGLTPQTSPTEHVAEIKEEAERIGTHLRLLKSNQREALMLLALGYSYREIADHKGWTYTKVNRSIREGRATLRKARGEEAA